MRTRRLDGEGVGLSSVVFSGRELPWGRVIASWSSNFSLPVRTDSHE
jgi:hypothetical protein